MRRRSLPHSRVVPCLERIVSTALAQARTPLEGSQILYDADIRLFLLGGEVESCRLPQFWLPFEPDAHCGWQVVLDFGRLINASKSR